MYTRRERSHTIVKLCTKLKPLTNTPLCLAMSNRRDSTEIRSKVDTKLPNHKVYAEDSSVSDRVSASQFSGSGGCL